MMKKIPNHLYIAMSSWVSRAVSASIQILSLKYLLDMLGEDGYAAFILLTSLAAWGALSDFGIGASLQNFISEQRAKDKKYTRYICTASSLTSILLLFLLIILWPISYLIAPLYLQSFSSDVIQCKVVTLYLCLSIFIITNYGSIIYKVWYAEQRGWLANLTTAVASCIGFGFVVILSQASVKISLNVLFLMFYLPAVVLPFIFFCMRLFIEFKKDNFSSKKYQLIRPVLNRALGFFVFAVIATIVLQADTIVMSQLLSINDIVTYSILMKIFGLILFVYSALLQALWPLCTEYRMQKKWKLLNLIVVKYIIFGFFLVVFSSISFYIFKVEILDLISSKINPNISWTIIALISFYFLLRIWTDTFSMLLQSMNYLKPLWYLVPIQAILSLVLQWQFAKYYGMQGMLLGLILSFLFTVVFLLPIFYKVRINKMIISETEIICSK